MAKNKRCDFGRSHEVAKTKHCVVLNLLTAIDQPLQSPHKSLVSLNKKASFLIRRTFAPSNLAVNLFLIAPSSLALSALSPCSRLAQFCRATSLGRPKKLFATFASQL